MFERAFGQILAELEQARENERHKIANELHDGIAQNLALAKMKLGLLKTSLPRKHMLIVNDTHRLISEVIDEMRCLICDLYPHGLRDLGLRAALEWLVQKIRENYGLLCVAEVVSMPPQLTPEIEDTMFQAVRELLTNVGKHARAKEARVTFRAEKGRMLIQVIDDGIGFKPSRVSPLDPRQGGFGLLSIRERLSRIGANMHIDSAPGQGTKITMTFNLDTERRARNGTSPFDQ